MLDGWGNGCEKVVVEWRLVASVSGLGNGCIVVELALRLTKGGRMSVRGRRKGMGSIRVAWSRAVGRTVCDKCAADLPRSLGSG